MQNQSQKPEHLMHTQTVEAIPGLDMQELMRKLKNLITVVRAAPGEMVERSAAVSLRVQIGLKEGGERTYTISVHADTAFRFNDEGECE